MNTVLVQLTHQKAESLLQNLEDMHIIKVVKTNIQPVSNSKRFAGKLSDVAAEALQSHITKSRNEWSDI